MAMIVVITISALVAVAAVSVYSEHAALMQAKKDASRQMVTLAHNIVSQHYRHFSEGEISENAAKQAALEMLSRLRFEHRNTRNEYYWVTDLEPRMLMHAVLPELDGQSLTTFTDSQGKRLFMEMRSTVSSHGEGYVSYRWPKPGGEADQPKISYVKLFEPWGWIIGSGVYIDDVNAIFWDQIRSQAEVILLALLLLTILVLLVIRGVERQIASYADQLQRSNNELQRLTGIAEEAQQLAHLGNWQWWVAKGEHEWSDELYHIIGVDPEHFTPTHKAFLEKVHPEDRPALERQIEGSLEEQTPFECDCRILLSDGSVRYIHIRAQVGLSASGGVDRLYGTVQDISRLKESEAALNRLAHHDPLTGLPNRLLLHARAEHALDQASRKHRQVAIMFIDLDRFKTVNDSLGHPTGDLLLQQVAERLSACVRKGDTVSRLGGDEFTLVLEELDTAEDARTIAAKILTSLATPFNLNEHEVFVSGSIGISLFPVDGPDVTTLFKNADTALYRAKEQGRNNYQYYTEALTHAAEERLRLEHELHQALQNDEFVLHYQPQVDMQQGNITGMEALLRWQHPDRGLLSPSHFLHTAEESGLIVPIGKWVLQSACRQNKEWLDAGISHTPVSVNLSAKQFHQNDLTETVSEVLTETGLPAEYLELEITESLAMRDVEASIRVLTQLKALGVHFSIDDFGTGYSSLSYLKRFPINKVKIDQSFIHNITTDPDDAAISRAIISLAHNMHLKVIAEGVEHSEQREFLGRRECDEFQGFYFSQALPSAAMASLLRDPASAAKIRPPTAATSQPGLTLLVVDDDRNVLHAFERLLRKEGYDLLLAQSPQQAFKLLATHSVSVVIADNRMPGMNGVEFLQRTRSMHPQAVRILLTGHPDWSTAEAAVNDGSVYKLVTKPWNDMELLNLIREAFRKSQHQTLPRSLQYT